MTKTSTAAVIIGLIVVGGIAYVFTTGDSAMMKEESESVMENKEGAPEAAMQGDTTMKDDAMVKDDAMKKEETMMKKTEEGTDAMMKKGSYEAYSAEKLSMANTGDVVLFFRATWCPTCKALDADIRAHMGSIPAGLTILDVNYDDSMALKKKYGVTYQHTFVQVTADGTQIKKWSASPTLAALVSEVQ